MVKIMLADATTEADTNAIARAFALSHDDVEQAVSTGAISRWFEVGEGDSDNKPHLILYSAERGIRVTIDETGNVISATTGPTGSVIEGAIADNVAPEGFASPSVDAADVAHRARLEALLDEALEESFPASDPVAISFDTPRRSVSSSTKD